MAYAQISAVEFVSRTACVLELGVRLSLSMKVACFFAYYMLFDISNLLDHMCCFSLVAAKPRVPTLDPTQAASSRSILIHVRACSEQFMHAAVPVTSAFDNNNNFQTNSSLNMPLA